VRREVRHDDCVEGIRTTGGSGIVSIKAGSQVFYPRRN
jgi:hypothetical protein